ncbi:endo-1,3-beta-glucanase [Colletotrichum graminicola]|uniref:Endo-1,3-beta-glucanase n=1 Tax=Colletotrichum graminicola (strain M1.001 / M2 / FGSC 10212) TaxID=645133 RepID=E3R0D3_COLGM|nr:endo-1,3-beta-glucanase [Colletotrichum graminicola M1.001]EFQ36571.1 endo-1,3-beta-glucanase [Colletotrichum graminicola M1.001]WDK22162.1 endo-1,3-beta-glucanase [Colletotrichum graminicola]
MSTKQALCLLPLLFGLGWSSPTLYPRKGDRAQSSVISTSTTSSLPGGAKATETPTPSNPSAAPVASGTPSGGNGTKPGGGGKPTLPEGYAKIVFQDDFSTQKAGALPDASKWTFDVGTGYPGGAANWGTQEIQTYTKDPANIAISESGTLTITPIKSGEAWTSSRIETNAAQDFKCPEGGKLRMEASIMIPASDPSTQAGIWPAFWSMGSAFRTNVSSWPSVGEIDMLEVSNGVGTVFQTAHCGVINGGPCKEKTGLSSSAEFPRGEFVKVACEVDRSAGGGFASEKLVWYVNDQPTKTITGQQVGDEAFWKNLAQTSKMILLNVAVGGEFPDAKAGSKTPTAQTVGGKDSRMEVKYVAVYSS